MELSIEEAFEKYPYLKDMAKYCLFKSKTEIEKINNSEKIVINGNKVPILLLRKIIEEDDYYDYALKFFNNEIKSFSAAYIIYGDTVSAGFYNKGTLIKAMEKAIDSGMLVLSDKEKNRYNILKESILLEHFIKDNQESFYDIEVDGNKYSILVSNIFSFMQMNDKDFYRICINPGIKEICNIPKEHFVYAIVQYFKSNELLHKYYIPDLIITRYREFIQSKYIDIEAINKYLEVKDQKVKQGHINEELKRLILNGMPEEITNLEKAIYIYIKMCKVLTYDDEYYAVNQKGEATLKHQDVNYLETITPTNNKVVCFEFNLIYSILLNELGIKFVTDYKSTIIDEYGESYGEGHANLTFRWNKFIVSADSVTTILQGDIMRAKLNQTLVGLKCLNDNKKTEEEFNEALIKMYQLVAMQESKNNTPPVIKEEPSLNDLLEEYSHATKNIKEVSLKERLSILIDKVNSTKMIGIDSLSYVLQLVKVLFTREQRSNNIGVTIIRNNEPFDDDKVAMASAIFYINERDFIECRDETIYYYYNPNYELKVISKEKLQDMFDNGTFELVTKDDPIIPGIATGGKKYD